MTVELKVPDAGESVADVEIGEWLKSEGDHVERDETVVRLETDKASMEVPAPAAGRLAAIRKNAGDVVEIGEVIAEIDTDGAASEEDDASEAEQRPAAEEAAPPKKRAESAPHEDEDEGEGEGEGEEEEEEQDAAAAEEKKTRAEAHPNEVEVVDEAPEEAQEAAAAAAAAEEEEEEEEPRTSKRARREEPEDEDGGTEGEEPEAEGVQEREEEREPQEERARTEEDDQDQDAEEARKPAAAKRSQREKAETDARARKEPEPKPKPEREARKGREAAAEGAPLPAAEDGSEEVRTAPSPDDEVVRMSLLRRGIARRLVEAQQRSALLTTFQEIDVSALLALRRRWSGAFAERHGTELGIMSLFVKAAIEALKEVPELNAEIRGDDIVYHRRYHIGIAVGSERGLVVPVLRDADRLSLARIEEAIDDFAARAESGSLDVDELRNGTFTITNGGVFGSLLSTPLVNPPQSGVLGMHAIQERPVARDGTVEVRPMMYVALTYDHRIVDGRESVRFLQRVKEVIEAPERLLLEA